MSRLIDADDRIEFIKNAYCPECDNYNGVRCRACPINDMIEAIDDAPTVDQWHYPSKGEYPPNMQEVLLCLHTEMGQEIVVGYRDTDSDLHEGGGHAWGWYDLGNNILQDFADESIKVVAWQYIMPPKEETE